MRDPDNPGESILADMVAELPDLYPVPVTFLGIPVDEMNHQEIRVVMAYVEEQRMLDQLAAEAVVKVRQAATSRNRLTD